MYTLILTVCLIAWGAVDFFRISSSVIKSTHMLVIAFQQRNYKIHFGTHHQGSAHSQRAFSHTIHNALTTIHGGLVGGSITWFLVVESQSGWWEKRVIKRRCRRHLVHHFRSPTLDCNPRCRLTLNPTHCAGGGGFVTGRNVSCGKIP